MSIDLRAKIENGVEQLQLRCPSCKTWNDATAKQVEGEDSWICSNCKLRWNTDTKDEVEVEIDAG